MRLALCSMMIRDHFSGSFYSFFVSDMLLEMEKHMHFMHLYVYICIYSLEIKNAAFPEEDAIVVKHG